MLFVALKPASQYFFLMRKILFPVLGTYFLLVFGVPYWQGQEEAATPPLLAAEASRAEAADSAVAKEAARAALLAEALPILAADDSAPVLRKPPQIDLKAVEAMTRRTAEDSIRQYIQQHKEFAIAEMYRMGIPASIKLAQGILESRYGTSELATAANNHFGLKATREWKGHIYYVYSQEWNAHLRRSEKVISAFRAFPTGAESYRHHSDFVRYREHYRHLFKFSRFQYREWAQGLSKAGYATDPEYANKLISLIERFQLYQYDHSTPTTATTRYMPNR